MRKNLIMFASFVFVVGVICGWNADSYANLMLDHKCVQKTLSDLSFSRILFVNLNVVILLILGCVTFGVTSVVNLLLNGRALGVVVPTFYPCLGITKMAILLLPHGIFEIPAIIIAGAAGFKIPYEIVRYLLGRKDQPLTKEDIKEYLTLAAISVILIVIAAWIEANVTLQIAKAMLNSTEGI